MLFLVRTKSLMEPGFPADERERVLAAERERAQALADGGKLIGNWKVPLERETITLWEVADPAELHEIVSSLPAAKWAKSVATPLVQRNLRQHAGDPPNKVA